MPYTHKVCLDLAKEGTNATTSPKITQSRHDYVLRIGKIDIEQKKSKLDVSSISLIKGIYRIRII